jgi:hypothetical protein
MTQTSTGASRVASEAYDIGQAHVEGRLMPGCCDVCTGTGIEPGVGPCWQCYGTGHVHFGPCEP